jgi:C-lobe and N-lobe beta barrels of Tf-binding protein B
MRLASIGILLAAGTALSGCAAEQLDAVANLSTGCSSTAQSLNCGGPVNPNAPPPVKPPSTTVVTTPTTTNVGNDSTLTTGDTTIAIENSAVVSIPSKQAVSKITIATAPNTAFYEINPNTADSMNWPKKKQMQEYIAGTNKGSGIGGTYKEYRAYTRDTTGNLGNQVDEELQVWTFANSHASQYRDVTGGATEAIHQAWSFGGNYTTAAAMPTSGTATYNGKFTSTAKTGGFIDTKLPTQTLSYNGLWSVVGDSTINANFGTGSMTGTLTPKAWTGWATLNGVTGYWTTTAAETVDFVKQAAGTASMGNGNWLVGVMDQPILLAGTITTNATTTSTTGNKHANDVIGTAAYDPASNWLNNTADNQMYAGFFGANADEVTGIFSVDATIPTLIGGQQAINNDKRAFVQMQGAFHACKLAVCP